MTTIILCSLNDHEHCQGTVYTMTVQRCKDVPSLDFLVPTKALVFGHKHFCGDARFAGYPQVSDEQYVTGYRELIKPRLNRIAVWYTGLPLSNEHVLTLCCYCRRGEFCHRQLVYKLLLWLNRKLHLTHVVELY